MMTMDMNGATFVSTLHASSFEGVSGVRQRNMRIIIYIKSSIYRLGAH